jgi:hypothetical protein
MYPLKESHTSTLQRDVEALTLSLEHEKREAAYLDEQIKLIQFELSMVPTASKASSSSMKASIAVLEKKLELENKKLDHSKLQNAQLREQINENRMERSAQKQSLVIIQNNLEQTTKAAEMKNEELARKNEEEEDQIMKIGVLRSKSASQRSKYDERISTLASFLKNSRQRSTFLYEEKSYFSQGIEILTVLKNVLRKAEGITLEKKKSIDSYIKHINILANCFESIKHATGLSKVDDIVTSCIKSEEQNQAVLQYFNNLNSEIDILEESLKINTEKITAIEGIKVQGSLTAKKFLDKTETHLKTITKKIETKNAKLLSLQEKIKDLVPVVVNTYKLLSQMNFRSYLKDEIDIQSVEKLNQETANLLLGQIEEYINNLLLLSNIRGSKSVVLNDVMRVEKKRNHSSKRFRMKEMLEDAELLEDADFDDIKVPISLEELKNRAKFLYEKRRTFLKSKQSENETNNPL